MSAVVQATCPGCKQVLRIPAEWLGQTFKCKHCGIVIQARPPAAAAPPVPRPVAPPVVARPAAKPVLRPVAVPAPPRAISSPDPFSFDEAGTASPRSRPRRRSSGGLVAGLVLLVVGLGAVAGGVVFAWPYLSALRPKPNDPFAQLVGETERTDGEALKESPPRETGKKSDLPVRHEASKKSDPPIKHETGKKSDLPPRREPGTKPPADLPVATGPFPRRALAVSINNYLYANPINYGMPIPGASNVQTLLNTLTKPTALRIPADQVALLSDAASDRVAVPPTESVIRDNIIKFLDTSRAQDRIILLIVGHVVEIEDEPILLPIEGAVDSRDSGIPLKWIYERLEGCKARQKVLILDTCRLDPAKGQERPGSGPMGVKLDAMLKEPPAGVQVWSSCVAEQYSYEFEGGDVNNGLFLEMLQREVGVPGGKIQAPADALPLSRLVEAVNARMKKELAPLGQVQISRLTGAEADDGAAPDPKEPAPPALKIARGTTARLAGDLTLVRAILKEVSFPPLKVAKDQKPLSAEALPPMPADTLKDYMTEGDPTPLREEVRKARALLADIAARHKLNDGYLAIAEGPLKMQVRRDQKEVAVVIGELTEQGDALQAMKEHRAKESKRWQATYDYVVARVDAQLAYLHEYEAVLGQILKGLAPPDPNLYRGWRLASQYDPQTGDSAAKKLATDARKKLDKIIKDYPNTPWAVLARRDKTSALGLDWKPTK